MLPEDWPLNGLFGWVLENPRVFKNPFNVSGQLGIFEFDGTLCSQKMKSTK